MSVSGWGVRLLAVMAEGEEELMCRDLRAGEEARGLEVPMGTIRARTHSPSSGTTFIYS